MALALILSLDTNATISHTIQLNKHIENPTVFSHSRNFQCGDRERILFSSRSLKKIITCGKIIADFVLEIFLSEG